MNIYNDAWRLWNDRRYLCWKFCKRYLCAIRIPINFNIVTNIYCCSSEFKVCYKIRRNAKVFSSLHIKSCIAVWIIVTIIFNPTINCVNIVVWINNLQWKWQRIYPFFCECNFCSSDNINSACDILWVDSNSLRSSKRQEWLACCVVEWSIVSSVWNRQLNRL